jgi:hypothetical protein
MLLDWIVKAIMNAHRHMARVRHGRSAPIVESKEGASKNHTLMDGRNWTPSVYTASRNLPHDKTDDIMNREKEQICGMRSEQTNPSL